MNRKPVKEMTREERLALFESESGQLREKLMERRLQRQKFADRSFRKFGCSEFRKKLDDELLRQAMITLRRDVLHAIEDGTLERGDLGRMRTLWEKEQRKLRDVAKRFELSPLAVVAVTRGVSAEARNIVRKHAKKEVEETLYSYRGVRWSEYHKRPAGRGGPTPQ